jgi:hypothetical protein
MRIVCVDFNGVLDAYEGWRGERHFDEPREGAREFLEELVRREFAVVVFTTRYPVDVWAWLRTYDLAEFVVEVTDRKPPAHVFVDDRAVCFRGDYSATLDAVDRFTAHWESQTDSHRRVEGKGGPGE